MPVELLSPAGDAERLAAAVAYGADAVYLAGSRFGMRAFAGNFDGPGLKRAIQFAHDKGVAVHVAVNTNPRNDELDGLPEYLEELRECGADALIVGDPGVFLLARRHAAGVKLHVSTQAGVTNYAAAQYWYDQGAGGGGLCPRGDVRQLVRAVRAVQLHDRPGRHQGRLRPALPVQIRPGGREAPWGVFPRL